jgi:uncharacterized protein (UPF0335 family)
MGGLKVQNTAIDIHNYASLVTLDDIADMLRQYARKVEELEEENEQLKQRIEDQKHNFFKGVNG